MDKSTSHQDNTSWAQRSWIQYGEGKKKEQGSQKIVSEGGK